MDGDSPNLVELFAVADRHEAMVVIDEAHATGVLGPQGRSLAAAFEGRRNVITLHTCGKALGTVGGFVLAPRVVRDFLVNRSRPFMFATAPSRLSWAPTRVRCAAARPMHSRCPARNPTALWKLRWWRSRWFPGSPTRWVARSSTAKRRCSPKED
jgi:8-amino-7-oxononanoate synthase